MSLQSYKIMHEIDKGYEGIVYSAIDENDSKVAIKILNEDIC